MQPGNYTFFHKMSRRYLSCSGRALVLSGKPMVWTLKQAGNGGFHIYAKGTELLLDIHNAWVTPGNTVKIWEYTGYDAQVWSLSENPNGSYSILHRADPRYCLGFAGGSGVLQIRDRRDPAQEWVAAQAAGPEEYRSFFSKGRVVELQLPPDIDRILPATRLQRWADQLETAYGVFAELTGFSPFRTVTVEGCKPAPNPGYAGWVYPGRNTIHVDRDFLRRDLEKMNRRRSDWNFCVLHEMGHMFDFGRPWNFEPELMTDLKVAYVMEKTAAAAAPAEFDASTVFYGGDIAQAYARLGGDFSQHYNIFGCTRRFLEIKDRIGWGPFRETFHYLQQRSSTYARISGAQKFQLFVQTLTRFSGQDIQRFFSAGEWNAVLRQVRQQ